MSTSGSQQTDASNTQITKKKKKSTTNDNEVTASTSSRSASGSDLSTQTLHKQPTTARNIDTPI